MLDKKFVPQFNITLRCNMYEVCKYCYVKKQKQHFPLDMDIEGFEQLLDAFILLGVDEIILLGGEPTLFPQLGALLNILSGKNVKVRLFTNGVYNTGMSEWLFSERCIETIFFHYDEDYLMHSKSGKEKFVQNMSKAFHAGKKIWIRWNINHVEADQSEVLSLAERFSANLGYSISVSTPNSDPIPFTQIHNYAEVLVKIVEAAVKSGIDVAPARAMPLCQFNPKQLDFLKKKGGLQGSCIAINDLTINTDLSLQLCSVTHQVITSAPTGSTDLRRKIFFLKGEERTLRRSFLLPECKDCLFFHSGECQGGCYGYKLYGNIRKRNFNLE